MSFSEVRVKVVPLRSGFLWVGGLVCCCCLGFFSLQCQGTPCSISFHLFFSRKVGQVLLRRDRAPCRAEAPKH